MRVSDVDPEYLPINRWWKAWKNDVAHVRLSDLGLQNLDHLPNRHNYNKVYSLNGSLNVPGFARRGNFLDVRGGELYRAPLGWDATRSISD